jgi:hypothetical protein
MSDKLQEALIKVRLKIACSPPFGRGWGRGAATGKRKVKLLKCAGFQPELNLFFGIDS